MVKVVGEDCKFNKSFKEENGKGFEDFSGEST